MNSTRHSILSHAPYHAYANLIIAGVLLGLFANAAGSSVRIDVQDETPFHSFPPGEPFSFAILATTTTRSGPKVLSYQWRDFRGRALGPVIPFFVGVRTIVESPSATPALGYYSLEIRANDSSVSFDATSTSHREFGFVVLPPKTTADRTLAIDSPFGVVHAKLDDPYLPTWVKTLTWNTVGPSAWNAEIIRRRNLGLQELPLVFGEKWTSNDNTPVSNNFVTALADKIRPYLQANSTTDHWELGIEENLRSRFFAPAYFANLKRKVAAIRAVADRENPDARFLFQIAETRVSDAERFFASEAAAEFDILAPHPYAWPDFPTPETWLDTYIDDLRSAMRKHELDFPMWFTEIGAPQNDARVPQMSSGKNLVRAHSRVENSAYLVKAHILALARGIEKIFWYNYRDRDTSPEDVEDHFGLIDYWGFPKPSYAAYVTMVNCLHNTHFDGRRNLSEGVRVYEFIGAKKRCLVAWSYPASVQSVALSTIFTDLTNLDVVTTTNSVGTPISDSGNLILDEFPAFILLRTVTEVTSN